VNQKNGVDFVNSPVNQVGFGRGFVPCPMAIIGSVTPEQILWQQQIYQRAYAEALAAIGVQTLKLPIFGPEARN